MAAMKWKGSLVRWFGSVYKMKRDKVYIYIYIYRRRRGGKKLRGGSKWYKLQPIPRIKVSKEQWHLFMDRSSARWTGYQVPLFKQGILPISPSPPLTDPPWVRDPFFPSSLFSPPSPLSRCLKFLPRLFAHTMGGPILAIIFFVRYREQVERFLMSMPDGCSCYFYRYLLVGRI